MHIFLSPIFFFLGRGGGVCLSHSGIYHSQLS
uniref:Uncharacterized protein n=1 Tax=Rhizophora mucronata TaxID=61149 RepID=A0A2P2NUT3_RHIMU